MNRLIYLSLIIATSCFLFSASAFSASFEPVNNFNDWSNQGDFQHSGNTTTVTTTSESNLWKEFSGAKGILAIVTAGRWI